MCKYSYKYNISVCGAVVGGSKALKAYIDTTISLRQYNSKPILCGYHWFGIYFRMVIIITQIKIIT